MNHGCAPHTTTQGHRAAGRRGGTSFGVEQVLAAAPSPTRRSRCPTSRIPSSPGRERPPGSCVPEFLPEGGTPSSSLREELQVHTPGLAVHRKREPEGRRRRTVRYQKWGRRCSMKKSLARRFGKQGFKVSPIRIGLSPSPNCDQKKPLTISPIPCFARIAGFLRAHPREFTVRSRTMSAQISAFSLMKKSLARV